MAVRRSTRPPTPPAIVELVERPAAVVRLDATMEGFPRLIGEAFGLTCHRDRRIGVTVAGHPFARYLAFGDRIEAEARFSFAGTLLWTDRILFSTVSGGRAGSAPDPDLLADPLTASGPRRKVCP